MYQPPKASPNSAQAYPGGRFVPILLLLAALCVQQGALVGGGLSVRCPSMPFLLLPSWSLFACAGTAELSRVPSAILAHGEVISVAVVMTAPPRSAPPSPLPRSFFPSEEMAGFGLLPFWAPEGSDASDSEVVPQGQPDQSPAPAQP